MVMSAPAPTGAPLVWSGNRPDEVVWHDLQAYNLAHQTFTGVAELDGAIHKAVEDLNRERAVVPLAKPRIVRRCPSRLPARARTPSLSASDPTRTTPRRPRPGPRTSRRRTSRSLFYQFVVIVKEPVFSVVKDAEMG